MSKVRLTITESRCRCGYVKNGAGLDYGTTRAECFDAVCPDECRVHIHGEVIEE